MDEQDRRVHLLERLRRLDYQILEAKSSEPETADRLKQERERLRHELNSILQQVA